MAFAFSSGFPFDNMPCFARASGNGSCHASAQAFAGPFGRACGQTFPFRDAAASELHLVETPAAYLIYFDATGFKREDVHVKVNGKSLKLSAKQGDAVAVERAWSIPVDVLIDDITAKFANNELTVTLPRIPQEPKASFDVPIESSTEAARPSTEAARPASRAQEPMSQQPEAPVNQEDNDQDVDGSWVEVADEDVTRAKEKGKAPADANVLEDAGN